MTAEYPQHDRRRWIAVVFVVALLMRAGFGAVQLLRADDIDTLEFPDEVQYWHMASSLAAGTGLQDEFGFRATRMPLYPVWLSVFTGMDHGVAVAKGLHWLIGALGAALTAGLGMSLFDRRTGVLAGLIVACDPFLVFLSSLLLTETLFIAGLVGLLWVVWSGCRTGDGRISLGRWLAAGVIAAFCVYVRESSLILIVAVFALVITQRRFERSSLFGVALAAGVVGAALLPWALRNRSLTGEWCWLTHRAGISLFDGVGPQATGASDLADIQRNPELLELGEAKWNRHFMRESIAAIKSEPGRILRLAGVKLSRMWNPVPNVETYRSGPVRFVSAAWAIPVFAFAAAGVILLSRTGKADRWRIVLLLLLPALYFSALHCLFVGSVRYRLPAMPMIEVLAAVPLAAILERLRPGYNPGTIRDGQGEHARPERP